MVDTVSLQPVNRHLLIVPHLKREEEQTGILLPEDYKPQEETHIVATVVDVSSDCASHFLSIKRQRERREILVDRSMIEQIEYRDKTFYLILENYVLGILRGRSEA